MSASPSGPIRRSGDAVLVEVWVVPGASREQVAGLHGDAVRVRVTAPPEAGKANQAVAAVLRRATGAGAVTLVRGGTGRRKTYRLGGITVDQVEAGLLR